MTDIALKQQDDTSFFYGVTNSDIETDDGLETAVNISLFTDVRVSLEELPPWEKYRRGWWGDEFADIKGDKIGSKIWLLDREKLNEVTASDLKKYAKESLDWMLSDGVADSIIVSTELIVGLRIDLAISITRKSGAASPFDFIWDAQGLRSS